MRTTTKWTLAALSAIALIGVAAAATPEGQQTTDGAARNLRDHFRAFHAHPVAAIDKVCDDNITWGECKELLKEKRDEARAQAQERADERYAKCLESNSQDYCDGRLDQFKASHPRLSGDGPAPGEPSSDAPAEEPVEDPSEA
jgi:hypothetical protein